jgi:hypothetical protein
LNKRLQVVLTGLVAFLLIAGLVWAFRFLGTPAEQRALRMDLKRIDRMESLMWEIERYYVYQEKPKLPESLDQLRASQSVSFDPSAIYDPLTRKPFEYRRLTDNEYELCAEFQTDFREEVKKGRISRDLAAKWMHPKGRYCFRFQIGPSGNTRRIEPAQKSGD